MNREISLVEVYGVTERGFVDAMFDTRVSEEDEPRLERLLVLNSPDYAYGRLVADVELPQPDPVPFRLYKSVFISRMSSEEAETMEAVLAAADAKLRLMFNSVEYFVSDDPLFATLTAAVGGALGAERAAELLASL